MLGRIYKRKSDGLRYRVVATTGAGWVLTPADEFGGNIEFTADALRRDFQRAQDAEAVPAAPTLDDQTDGWRVLSAEAKFAALASAAVAGDLQPGDYLAHPTVGGDQVFGAEPVTREDVSKLKAYARQFKPKAPTPEQTFRNEQREEITEEADRVWDSGGPGGLLAAYELGTLEVGPAIADELDRRIRRRNRLHDREAYPNAHVFDRGGRNE